MQEPQSPLSGRDAPPPSEQIKAPGGLFSDLKYPGVTPPPLAARPTDPAVAQPNKMLSRVVLPLVIFVIGIAVVAWVSQYLPGRSPPANLPAPTAKLKIEFVSGPREEQKPGNLWLDQRGEVHYSWGLRPDKEPGKFYEYVAEYETITNGQPDKGFCDFEFKNSGSRAIEVGLASTYCQCSGVELALPTAAQLEAYHRYKATVVVPHGTRYGTGDDFKWLELKRQEDGVVVAPGQAGIVRLRWDGRNTEAPKTLLLNAKLWTHPQGVPQDKVEQTVKVMVNYVPPVRFAPPELPVEQFNFRHGKQESNEYTLTCWSSTRDLVVHTDPADPFVTVTANRLSAAECREFQKTLEGFGNVTTVRSAYQLVVKVWEEKAGKQLGLGAFEKFLPVRFEGNEEKLLDVKVPKVRGTVRGDLKVNGSSERLQINLGPITPRSRPEPVKIWTKADDLLPEVKLEPAVPGLTATIKKAKEGTDQGGIVWDLTVTVGQNVPGGALEDIVAVLRRQHSPQTIRLPLTGHVSHK